MANQYCPNVDRPRVYILIDLTPQHAGIDFNSPGLTVAIGLATVHEVSTTAR